MSTYEELTPLLAIYDGVVKSRNDPLRVGRVRVVVPGLVEGDGVWAWPIGSPGSGSNARGFFFVPEVGADVAVLFKQGDPERARYLPGMWGLPEGVQQIPEAARDLSPEDTPLVRAIDFTNYEVVVDERPGRETFRIRDKRSQEGTDGNADIIEFDGVKRGITIRGTLAVQIESAGAININALQVRINKRIVRDTLEPI
jgi:hypothetical protein